MTISTTDLKIYRSQRNRDTADGGGAMSPNEVIDGELNNVFDDISSLDRVTGRVSIRKVFPGVFSDNTDRYFGANLVIVAPAEDPAVDVLMTATGNFTDERADVVERIESYLIRGATIPWRLFNDHLQGTGALTLFAVEDAVTPGLGDTLFLESTSNPNTVEAVRIQQIVSRSTQTFVDENGAFQRDVLILQLSRPLQADWGGTEVRRTTTATPPTRLRTATVSAGARYSGVKSADDVAQGALSIKVNNPFARIVPSTRAETPITDENATLSAISYAKVGADNAISATTGSQSFNAGQTRSFFFGGTVFPGSVTVTGTAAATDDGGGRLVFEGSGTSGVVDYRTGEVSITRISAGSASFGITATPGAAVSDSTLTTQITVTPQTRANNYIRTLRPTPAPGTVSVDYRALDNWFRLRDNGNGVLAGAQPGEGGGTINYATGTVTATLAALPDVGTSIIISWGTAVNISTATDLPPIDLPEIAFTLPDDAIVPGSLELTYLSGVSTITLGDDGAGNITASATPIGRIVYATGEVAFRPASFPNSNAAINFEYGRSTDQQAVFTPSPSGGNDAVSFTLTGAPIRPGTVRLQWDVRSTSNGRLARGTITTQDDGNGGFVGLTGVATINYATGEVAFNAAQSIEWWRRPIFGDPTFVPDGQGGEIALPNITGFETLTATGRFESGANIAANWQSDAAASTSVSDSIAAPPIQVRFAPLTTDAIVPGSVRFTMNGRIYVDRQGDLVFNPAVATNAGTLAGTINYQTGRATITGWAAGNFELNLIGLGVRTGSAPTSRLFFRSPAAPLLQGSLTIQVIAYEDESQDQTLITATSDSNGVISGPQIQGSVDFENGIVEVFTGQRVTAAGNEAEWWYDAAAVDTNGQIFRPFLISPGSATFSAVAFVSIPLDPQILGLDPIRLPTDGRVPIFRPGDALLISQRNTVEASSATAGGTVDLGIENVRWVRVKDDTGAEVLSEHYTVDGPNGVLTWANPLDLSAFAAPYRIECMAYYQRLCTDVQINGTIGIAAPAPFALNNADAPVFLSSALIFTPDGGNQDLQALYTNLFTQASWTNVWSNEPIGQGTTGQYDDATYPIAMRNDGSITERWRIQFTGSGTVNVIGERLGQILTGVSITQTIAPVNPATGQPYFSINPLGWSAGWVTGNVVRFNTLGANYAVWLIRSTQPGDPDEQQQDRFIAHLMGDVALESN